MKKKNFWSEKEHRYRVPIQYRKQRKVFTSPVLKRKDRDEEAKVIARAEAWLAAIKQGKQPAAKLTVAVAWQEYLEDRRENTSTNNYEQVEKFGRNYILPLCAEIKLDQLTQYDFQKVLNEASRRGCLREDSKRKPGNPLSKKTLQGIRSVEMGFVNFLNTKAYSGLTLNKLKIPTGAVTKGEKKILQPDALKTLWTVDTCTKRGKVLFDSNIYAFRFAVLTGLRPGELLGLQLGDISNGIVTIRRSINHVGETTQGKNKNAHRSFALNALTKKVYEQQLALLQSMGMGKTAAEKLFPCRSESSLYHCWQLYQTSNRINPPVSLYELRHTFVSVVHNLPDGEVKAVVGHSKNMDTRGVYGHHIEGMEWEIANSVASSFYNVLEKETFADAARAATGTRER